MEKRLRIYYTSDLHGQFMPTDYSLLADAKRGLLRLLPEMEKDENSLYIDGGDLLQGSPWVAHCHEKDEVEKIAELMNEANLDFYALGNHDFNYGASTLARYIERNNAVCVTQNVELQDGKLRFPARVHTLPNGLKVGLVGVVTDYIKLWERPENLVGINIRDPFEAAKEGLQALKNEADLTVCIYHGGFERDLETGERQTEERENIAYQIAEELDFDVLLTAHQHLSIPAQDLHGAIVLQPAAYGVEMHQLDLYWEDSIKRFEWKKIEPIAEPDEERFAPFFAIEEELREKLNVPLGRLDRELKAEKPLTMALEEHGLASLFAAVALEYSGADVVAVSLAQGIPGFEQEVGVRDVLSNYPYLNHFVILNITVADLRKAMERSASYFIRDEAGEISVAEDFLKPKTAHYNYDYYAGIEYTLDLRNKVGERVVSMKKEGRELSDEEKITLCLSDYRATGTGGYKVYQGQEKSGEFEEQMTELIFRYFREGKQNSELAKRKWMTLIR